MVAGEDVGCCCRSLTESRVDRHGSRSCRGCRPRRGWSIGGVTGKTSRQTGRSTVLPHLPGLPKCIAGEQWHFQLIALKFKY